MTIEFTKAKKLKFNPDLIGLKALLIRLRLQSTGTLRKLCQIGIGGASVS
ncbi:hypothetical protein [Aliterella atlantica]|nr:hypothetical protein [Aliterella atlantica]